MTALRAATLQEAMAFVFDPEGAGGRRIGSEPRR
jgi:hypothetical protein